jgi:hypothetical protein
LGTKFIYRLIAQADYGTNGGTDKDGGSGECRQPLSPYGQAKVDFIWSKFT